MLRKLTNYDNYTVSDKGDIFNKRGQRIKPFCSKQGYYQVSLCKDGEIKKEYVHRIVAREFLNNGEDLEKDIDVHHLNGNKTDNTVKNLSLTCRSDHRSYHSTENNKGRKLSEKTKDKIREKHIGMRAREETKKKMSNSYNRKVSVLCVETGDRFDTIDDASKWLGKDRRGIYGCIHGIQKTSGGYHWVKDDSKKE